MISAGNSSLKLVKAQDGRENRCRKDRSQLRKLSPQEPNQLTLGQASIVAAFLLVIVVIPAVDPVTAPGDAQGRRKLKEQDIIQKVLRGYDWRVRPRGRNESHGDTGGPVLVTVNIYLRSISKIDDVNMEYSSQFTFREEWWDPRLAYGRLADEETEVPPFVILATTEHADTSQQIWMPDTFAIQFQNEKEARRHLIDKPNVLIRIYPNGNILYSVRLSLVLSCPMSLENYPLDKQTCLIDMASYAYTTDDIKYEWKLENPIQQKDGLKQSLPSFELQDVTTDYCTSKTNTGEYSCVRVRLMLRREYSYYLIQLYIPCVMLVVVSWVSFWLDKDAVPARVSLGVTTLLTMTTQASGINSKLPPVSYIKAVDVWIGSCLAFIFSALLEYALVNYYGRREFMNKESSKKRVSGYGLLPTNAFMASTPTDTNANYMSTLPPPPISPEIFTTGYDHRDTPQSPLSQRQTKQSRQHSSVRLDMVGGWEHLSLTPPRRKSTIASVGAGRVKRALVGSRMEISKSVDIISRYMFPALFGAFLTYYYIAYVQ